MTTSLPISLAAEPVFYLGAFPVTNAFLTSVLLSLIVAILLLFLPRKLSYIPTGVQNGLEWVYEQLMGLVNSVVGDQKLSREVMPLISTFFLFIILHNWLGLLPGFGAIGFHEIHEGKEVFVPLLRGSNSDINQTLALSLVTVTALQYYGFKYNGKSYLKKFFNFKNPITVFVGFLELISDLVKILSFTFRLYGNIFAGEVLLIVISAFVPYIAPIPFLALEIFAGFIQAVVFCMLSLVFFKQATQSHAH